MKAKIKRISEIALITLFVSCMVYPLIYWCFNSELSQMQVFLKCWYIIIGAIVLGAINLTIKR